MKKNTREQDVCHWESTIVPSRTSSSEAENGAEVSESLDMGSQQSNQERPPTMMKLGIKTMCRQMERSN